MRRACPSRRGFGFAQPLLRANGVRRRTFVTADPLPPSVRSRLAGLRLVTRRATGAGGIGLHASRSRGAGLEFAQYRPYEPGDEPRQIDWKLYARADRFFVREAERESPVALWMLIDATASMAQADARAPGWTRWAAARALAAALGELALAGGDRFGWVVVADGALELAVPAAGVRQRDRLRRDLAPARGDGRFPPAERLAPILASLNAMPELHRYERHISRTGAYDEEDERP